MDSPNTKFSNPQNTRPSKFTCVCLSIIHKTFDLVDFSDRLTREKDSTLKNLRMKHFETSAVSKELPKAIIIKQAVSLISLWVLSENFRLNSLPLVTIFKKKIYIEETLKGIVRTLNPLEYWLEYEWKLFYKLYLHMKYGQGELSFWWRVIYTLQMEPLL